VFSYLKYYPNIVSDPINITVTLLRIEGPVIPTQEYTIASSQIRIPIPPFKVIPSNQNPGNGTIAAYMYTDVVPFTVFD